MHQSHLDLQHQQQHIGQPHHHHTHYPQQQSLQPTTTTMASINQQQQQQQDARPQDVLAEARKNLQLLIDSGLSKDILHQWVDGTQSVDLLNSPAHASIAAALPQSLAPPQSAPPPPPAPQCPPPPIPIAAQAMSAPAIPSHKQTMPTPPADVKPNPMTMSDDVSGSWSSAPASMMTSTMPEADHGAAALYMASSIPLNHRARISVSSTSSGSSGHASIWSTNSAQSSMSWHSAASNPSRVHAPLPMPPSSSKNQSTQNSAQGAFNLAALPVAPANSPTKLNIYWCTSCETSFKRKYDWKRHEDEFHERWRKYPCPEPGCNRSFWGSNSFNQHHKQCHGCKTCPHAEKVVKFLRKRKYWACGFCSALHPARERHVEHVARHFESGLTKSDWMHSRVVYGLLHQPLIHEAWEALVLSKQSEYAGRRPQFSWHPSKTGRAQGFLEKECPGQLQDLLEFFSGDDGEAQWIVTVAYDLADVVMNNTSNSIHRTPSFASSMGGSTYSQDHRVPYATLPSQAQSQPPVLTSSDQSGHQNPFIAAFAANQVLVPSQQYSSTQQQPSPDSSTQSPMACQSPIGLSSQSPIIKRELPTLGHGDNDGSMDFEYSSSGGGAAVFEDWESLNNLMMEEPVPQPSTVTTHSSWMVPYFN